MHDLAYITRRPSLVLIPVIIHSNTIPTTQHSQRAVRHPKTTSSHKKPAISHTQPLAAFLSLPSTIYTTTLLASLATIAGLAAAAPVNEARDSRPPSTFRLQSKVKSSSPKDLGSNKQKLWPRSYHTGAGLGAATFSATESDAPTASLNATGEIYQVGFSLGDYQWPMAVQYGTYQTMEDVAISVSGDQDTFGFHFNDNGLQWNYTEFAGWAACDFWYSDSPSLFATVSTNKDADLPKTCSEIELVAVAA